MKRLTIELTKGAKRELQSIGWKTPKPGDRRLQFYVLDQAGKPMVVTLKPAMPQSYHPWYQRDAPAVFSREPFPEAVCVEISPRRLLAPPCYGSRKDFEEQLLAHPTPQSWERTYWQTHGDILILRPEDDGMLKERLDRVHSLIGDYRRDVAAFRERAKGCSEELQKELDIIERDFRLGPLGCRDWLNVTLTDIKRGCEGIRDDWMRENWANENGENLNLMMEERRLHCGWLQTHTGSPDMVINATSRESGQRVVPPLFGEKFEGDPCFQEACASVRYRARFADNAKTFVYLANCELREELTAQEVDEAAELKGILQPVQAKATTNFQHSTNYRQLFWVDNGKQEQANLTKIQASAFSALHNAKGLILAREEWQQEIYGDEPPSDFRPDKLFQHGDGRKVWLRFIRNESDRYRLVM